MKKLIIMTIIVWTLLFISLYLLWSVDWKIAVGVFIFIFAHNLEKHLDI